MILFASEGFVQELLQSLCVLHIGTNHRVPAVQVAREIQIHSALEHEHIITLYGAFEDGKHVYLVQEFAPGVMVVAAWAASEPVQGVPVHCWNRQPCWVCGCARSRRQA